MRQKPVHHGQRALLAGDVKRGGAVAVAGFGQARVGIEHAQSGGIFAFANPIIELVLRRTHGRVGTAHCFPSELLFLFHRGHDFTEFPLLGEHVRRGGVAVRIDAFVRVGPGLHQCPHHRLVAAQDRVMKHPVFVILGHVQFHQLGTLAQQGASLRHISLFNRLDETAQGHPVEVRSQFRPAFEAVFPRDHQLGVVKVKASFGDGAFRQLEIERMMPSQTGESLGMRLLELPGQFLGLDLKLAQAGPRG